MCSCRRNSLEIKLTRQKKTLKTMPLKTMKGNERMSTEAMKTDSKLKLSCLVFLLLMVPIIDKVDVLTKMW